MNFDDYFKQNLAEKFLLEERKDLIKTDFKDIKVGDVFIKDKSKAIGLVIDKISSKWSEEKQKVFFNKYKDSQSFIDDDFNLVAVKKFKNISVSSEIEIFEFDDDNFVIQVI